ncbi:MAG: hypothetical protein MZV70_16875 [Desulfobacterales bacterium]|nr:hypothetical protein [Desulfobacterales bacterium]
MGEEAATNVFKHLDPLELARVIPMMARVKITTDSAEGVIRDFYEKTEHAMVGVDEEYIKSVLTKAFGDEQAGKLIEKIASGASAFDIIRWLDAGSIATMLLKEHPQTIAIVLAHLEATQAAEVLAKLPESLKIEVSLMDRQSRPDFSCHHRRTRRRAAFPAPELHTGTEDRRDQHGGGDPEPP